MRFLDSDEDFKAFLAQIAAEVATWPEEKRKRYVLTRDPRKPVYPSNL